MKITYHNGKLEEENIYYTNEGYINLGTRQLNIGEIPKITMTEDDLRILFYGNKIIMWLYQRLTDLAYLFVVEQDNKLNVVDYWVSTLVRESYPLADLITKKYSLEYEENCVAIFTNNLNYVDYLINPEKLKEQINTFLFSPKPESVAKGTKSILQVAKETGLPYQLLWNRVNRSHLTLEQAVALGKPRHANKHTRETQTKLYNGKTLKEIASENGVKYKSLWSHIYKGRTVEEALEIMRANKESEVNINE